MHTELVLGIPIPIINIVNAISGYGRRTPSPGLIHPTSHWSRTLHVRVPSSIPQTRRLATHSASSESPSGPNAAFVAVLRLNRTRTVELMRDPLVAWVDMDMEKLARALQR